MDTICEMRSEDQEVQPGSRMLNAAVVRAERTWWVSAQTLLYRDRKHLVKL